MISQNWVKKGLLIFLCCLIGGCLGTPKGVDPVQGFELEKYLGKWYEIARLDHSFERGLEQVTAEYSLRSDGGVDVKNRGFSQKKGKWKEATGKAYFVGPSNEGYLKVSFFGPFYGSYIVFTLEKEGYDYAFIAGPDLSYLWLLSRTPTLPQSVIDEFIEKSSKLGFDVDKLIMVKQ